MWVSEQTHKDFMRSGTKQKHQDRSLSNKDQYNTTDSAEKKQE